MVTVDIDTLGGAGFASQRFLFGPLPLHLPEIQYRGLCLVIHPDPHLPNSNSNSNSDSNSNSESNNNNNNNNVMAKYPKKFTVVLKTTLNTVPPDHPKTPPTPEPASLSYEADFTPQHKSKHDADVPSYGEEICIGWSSFTPMYRGKEVGSDDPIYKPLSSESVYEMSLMCRSGFGDQKGEFGLVVGSIGGWKREDEEEGGLGWWVLFQGIAGWVRAWLGLGGEGSVRLDDKRSTV